jgi:hypothetical protein
VLTEGKVQDTQAWLEISPCKLLAHCALVGLPQYFTWREAARAFIDKIRDREVKYPLLTCDDRTLDEALKARP